MRVIFHKKFEKQYAKLGSEEKQKFKERRDLFLINPFNPILNNHSVDKAYPGCRSINITGDYRAVYKLIDRDTTVFVDLGTHSELYS